MRPSGSPPGKEGRQAHLFVALTPGRQMHTPRTEPPAKTSETFPGIAIIKQVEVMGQWLFEHGLWHQFTPPSANQVADFVFVSEING